MNALTASLAVAVATAALAAAGTYLTTRRNLQATFDTSLRDLRIETYKILWKDLEELAKYGRPEPMETEAAGALAVTLRTWYYETGGLFLSVRTRQDYFALLDGLETAAAQESLQPDDDEFLRVLGSRLRTGMTADVGTRRTYPFREESRYEAEPVQVFTHPDGRELVVARGPRRFRLFGRRRPKLTVDGMSTENWDPGRREFSLVPKDGASDTRVFLLEGATKVVEGPKGWERGETAPRRGGAVWRKSRPGSSS